ncbi:DUF6531 domain-containing protein [Tumebacillus sp. DT12]|uniref:DUF6531 domain-containing protein n=1 Tax=Tumebacillus lacus TaxID=2995335 RepID=A0ABT3WZU0_9BACL|nr:DUF6531 domain-containing protein [Tumebacillus lacus]MCX7570163.1 DUF6531 domain-containing protein [Tumebacillus lacus]
MNNRFRRGLLSALLSVAVVASTLLPAFATPVNAAYDGEWDPLNEGWMPEDGATVDPVQMALRSAEGGGQSAGTGSNPVESLGDPSGELPKEPVDIASGQLVLDEKDFAFPGYGPALEVARSYKSDQTERLGMFGYGWSIPQERSLRMYDNFSIVDQKADGSTDQYLFEMSVPAEDAVVEEYDGAPLIYYPLHLGTYKAERADNRKQLTRRSQHDYLLVDPDTGMRYAFFGYQAAWRTDAPKQAGKLLRYADQTGLVMLLEYDGAGRIEKMRGNALPSIQFAYNGAGLVETVADRSGQVYRYGYTGHDLTQITRPDGSVVTMAYDGSHRITMRAENGVATYFEYENGKVHQVKNARQELLFSY